MTGNKEIITVGLKQWSIPNITQYFCIFAGSGEQPPSFDGKIFAIAFSLAHIPLFAGIAVAVVIGVYCCYRRKKRSKADLATIAEKGGLIVLDDQLLRAKEEGRLTVNVSILENGKVCVL